MTNKPRDVNANSKKDNKEFLRNSCSTKPSLLPCEGLETQENSKEFDEKSREFQQERDFTGKNERMKFYTMDEMFGDIKMTWWESLIIDFKIWVDSLPDKLRVALINTFWPKCDICKKRGALFEHYLIDDVDNPIETMRGYINICWECALEENLEIHCVVS